MNPKELDVIRLLRPLPEHGLPAGAEGTVVMDYSHYPPEDAPASYEVEFTTPDGGTLAVATVGAEDVKVVDRHGTS